MFKVGDLVVLPYTNLRKDVFQLTQENMILYNKHGVCYRHATEQEIAAGHRIDKSPLLQHLDKCEEVVKTWPKWKQQSIRDAFGIPKLEDLRNCDTSPNCKKYEVK